VTYYQEPVTASIEMLADAGAELVSIAIYDQLRSLKLTKPMCRKIQEIVRKECEKRYPQPKPDLLQMMNDSFQARYRKHIDSILTEVKR
jgi:hypothetical protein